MYYRVHYEVGDREFIRDFGSKEVADCEIWYCQDLSLSDGTKYSAYKITKIKESEYVGAEYRERAGSGNVPKPRKRKTSAKTDAVKISKKPAKRKKANSANKA
jgi:hypothetical protein